MRKPPLTLPVLAALLLLSACAGQSPVTTAAVTLAEACSSYAKTLTQLSVLEANKALTLEQAKTVDDANSIADPICRPGVVPADVASATTLVVSETSAISALLK